MQLLLENFWASALSILETEIIECQQLEEALKESQEEIQQKQRQLEQAQQELKRAEAQVIQSEKLSSLRKQITSVVHQINNPVNFIDGNLGCVRTYAQDLLHIMHLYAKHYPQPAAEIQSAIEEVDFDFLSEDLPKILSTMQMATERLREIIIFFSKNVLGLNKPEMIVVDPSETATHYSPTITIRTGVSVDQTRALIQIVDNGSGMTEESQRWLFDPSSMAKLRCIPDIRQSLYLSHQIVVEKHGGQLKCVSVPGKGTEFTIEIPIRQSHQQPS